MKQRVGNRAVSFQNKSQQSEYPELGYLDCWLLWPETALIPTFLL